MTEIWNIEFSSFSWDSVAPCSANGYEAVRLPAALIIDLIGKQKAN